MQIEGTGLKCNNGFEMLRNGENTNIADEPG